MNKITDNIIIGPTGCWDWQKSTNSAGYGQITIKGKYWTTHRYVMSLSNNLNDSDVVRHICHNTKCCNPDHLLIGTHKDNYYDSIEIHDSNKAKKRLTWKIAGKTYDTCREAIDMTGLSPNTIIKYTCPETREFDVKSYRKAAKIAGWSPKV